MLDNDDEDDINQIYNDLQKHIAIYHVRAYVETLIQYNYIEILTDVDGRFSYRLTKIGKQIFEEQTGLSAPTHDIYLD